MSDTFITGCLSDLKSHRKNSALPGHLGSAVLKISIFLGFERILCKDQSCHSQRSEVQSHRRHRAWRVGGGKGPRPRMSQEFAFLHLLFWSDPVEEIFPLLTDNKAF